MANAEETKEVGRTKRKYFSRDRKLKFRELVLFVLSKINTSSQQAINQFFEHSLKLNEHMTQQALSKARLHMNHKPFEKMFRYAVAEQYNGEYDIEQWEGNTVLAFDGSTLQLPAAGKLAKEFGTLTREPTAKISILYDVLNEIIVDGKIESCYADEREMAKEHIETCFTNQQLEMLKAEKVIILADRGYPSEEFIKYLIDRGLKYVIRCRKDFNNKVEAALNNEVVPMGDAGRVRVLKLILDGGGEETLLTNLYDTEQSCFKSLYFMRWGIETKYGMLKQKHILENFSGYSKNVILQDFWATLHVTNLCAIACNEANEELEEERKDKRTKYKYVVNYNECVGTMKSVLLSAVFVDSKKESPPKSPSRENNPSKVSCLGRFKAISACFLTRGI